MGNIKETQKRKLSEDYFADEEMNDESRHGVRSKSKRFKPQIKRKSRSPSKSAKRAKRKSRSPSKSTRRDKRSSRSMSKSPKKDYYEDYNKCEVPLYQKGDFYFCKDCECSVSGIISWKQHLAGKRHNNNIGGGNGVESGQYSSRKRKTFNYPREVCNMKSKRKLVKEPIQGEKNCVGLDYVLVIRKQERSIFQCFLCDVCTVYRNSKQLVNHILGDTHQKAYMEQHSKGLIQIKRLKSRHPGKESLEESIERKLLNPNRTETNSKPKYKTSTLEDTSDSQPSFNRKSSKKNYSSTSYAKKAPSNNFLRKTIEQAELYNRRLTMKFRSTTIVPERRFNCPAPARVTSKVSTRATSPTGTVTLSDDDCTIPSSSQSTKAVVPDIFELAVALTPTDCFNLVLLKMKDFKLSKEDIPLLNMVADEASTLSKKFTKECLNSMSHKEKESKVEDKQIPFPNEVDVNNTIKTEDILIEMERIVIKEVQDQCQNHQKKETIMEKPASPANVDQNPPIVLPDSFWNSLPSSRELNNILSCNPVFNLFE